MSPADNVPFSVAQQKALISAGLNSTLLFSFLFGIYTGLFPATIYIYIHKENRTRAKDRIIIGSVTALYLITALINAISCYDTNILFVTHSGNRVELFIESADEEFPLGVEITSSFTTFLSLLIADGLLVWRCFHSCGGSLRRCLLPIALLTIETVLVISALVFSCLLNAIPDFHTIHTSAILNHLSAAAYTAVVATSLVSTGLICVQIWRLTRQSSRSRNYYQTIIRALIESSALYTVAVLFEAILDFNDTGSLERSFEVFLISNYGAASSQIIAGLAPTLMIARLFWSTGQEDAQGSSASLPSEFVSHAFESHANGANTASLGTDLEIQHIGFTGEREHDSSEEIQAVPRAQNEFNTVHGQVENELEDRIKIIV
ncbi:hypothetical protein CPC08DRAFT_821904 [Agrocybe pediades]|nr:hypothetical protein CPC08DRAFT_821904 [Agrocybe pediades]